jgi:hypothetical protein
MAIQPSDLGEQFIRSGKRLITQRSADALLNRVTNAATTMKAEMTQESVKH